MDKANVYVCTVDVVLIERPALCASLCDCIRLYIDLFATWPSVSDTEILCVCGVSYARAWRSFERTNDRENKVMEQSALSDDDFMYACV